MQDKNMKGPWERTDELNTKSTGENPNKYYFNLNNSSSMLNKQEG